MKKLVQAFLWGCTALFLGQLCILGMAAAKGHFNRNTLTHIVALLSGIDIRGDQIGEAIQKARTAPMPTSDEIKQAKITAVLEADSKMASLYRRERELLAKEQAHEKEKERLAILVAEYRREKENNTLSIDSANLKDVTGVIELLEPAKAKTQLTKMLENGKKDDVISILMGMDADKQRKILDAFDGSKDDEDLAKILEEIRNRGKAPKTESPKA
jgi:hypothetical protein